MSQNPAIAYRPDIDGLRAIAVLSVVLYHFGIGGLSGGFVGVDVFFVISGFLITGIIQREIEQGRFTFAGFYERRIRRIFPALFVVLAATLAVGTAILLPTDLILLGKSTLATLLFSSNILFWRTSGYFDTTSEINPLLHTWSLAVEEQFYIFLPIFLILVYRFAKNYLSILLVIGILGSFAACLLIQKLRPDATFYLSPFRAWELLIGSYLAVGKTPRLYNALVREVFSMIGLFGLIMSIAFIPKGPSFPGWIAAVPVISTAIILHANGSGQTMLANLLSSRPIVFIGLISYSLYLWHWPVVVFLKYTNALQPLGYYVYVGFLLSVILAIVSYIWIESPFREKKILHTWIGIQKGAIFSALILSVTAAHFIKTKGIPERFNDDIATLDSKRNNKIPFLECNGNQDLGRTDCIIQNDNNVPKVLIWGDSHALAITPALGSALRNSASIVLAYKNACPPLLEIKVTSSFSCENQNINVINNLNKFPSIRYVVMHAEWSEYQNKNGKYSISSIKNSDINNKAIFDDALVSTINALVEKKIKVIVIGPIPRAPNGIQLSYLFHKYKNSILPEEYTYAEYLSKNKDFFTLIKSTEVASKIQFIDPSVYLCNTRNCSYMMDNELLYMDDNHLKYPGSLIISPFIRSNFRLN